MKVSIVGAGYVGLVSGACLARLGHEVTCIDLDDKRIGDINSGEAPFYEPGLNDILEQVVGKSLFATSDFDKAIRESELTLIAVGTPSLPDGGVDLGAIRQVAKQIGAVLRDKDSFHVVVVKSTVPPGTTENVVGLAIERESGLQRRRDFGLGMNPEFLTEGTAVDDFQNPDRIVIGGSDEKTLSAQETLFSEFADVAALKVNNDTAEMIKYMSNAVLATMISFSNEFANLCSAAGNIDAADVQRGVHLSRYLTSRADNGPVTAAIASFVEAGCGFGGSCLPKDVKGLVDFGQSLGVDMQMLRSVLDINAAQPRRMIDKLSQHFESLKGLNVAVLGLSFRPDTNDMRESPAIPVIDLLAASGCAVRAYDPKAIAEARHVITTPGVVYCDSLQDCVDGADAVLIVTRWSEFEGLPALLKTLNQEPLIVDGRRIISPDAYARYDGIGL